MMTSLTYRLPGALLHLDFLCLIKHHIHIFIKANDVTFNAKILVLIQPNLNSCSGLKVPED